MELPPSNEEARQVFCSLICLDRAFAEIAYEGQVEKLQPRIICLYQEVYIWRAMRGIKCVKTIFI